MNEPTGKGRRGIAPLESRALRKTESLVIAEDKPTAAQEIRVRDFSASRRTKPTEMGAGLFESSAVFFPSVGSTKIVVKIIVIGSAVEGVRTALGHNLHLASRAAIEICRLVRS